MLLRYKKGRKERNENSRYKVAPCPEEREEEELEDVPVFKSDPIISERVEMNLVQRNWRRICDRAECLVDRFTTITFFGSPVGKAKCIPLTEAEFQALYYEKIISIPVSCSGSRKPIYVLCIVLGDHCKLKIMNVDGYEYDLHLN